MTVTCQLKSKGIGIEGIYRVIKIKNDIEYINPFTVNETFEYREKVIIGNQLYNQNRTVKYPFVYVIYSKNLTNIPKLYQGNDESKRLQCRILIDRKTVRCLLNETQPYSTYEIFTKNGCNDEVLSTGISVYVHSTYITNSNTILYLLFLIIF